jgi:hypothetical protein
MNPRHLLIAAACTVILTWVAYAGAKTDQIRAGLALWTAISVGLTSSMFILFSEDKK